MNRCLAYNDRCQLLMHVMSTAAGILSLSKVEGFQSLAPQRSWEKDGGQSKIFGRELVHTESCE
jgi:hypothetical protein